MWFWLKEMWLISAGEGGAEGVAMVVRKRVVSPISKHFQFIIQLQLIIIQHPLFLPHGTPSIPLLPFSFPIFAQSEATFPFHLNR